MLATSIVLANLFLLLFFFRVLVLLAASETRANLNFFYSAEFPSRRSHTVTVVALQPPSTNNKKIKLLLRLNE